MNIMMTNLIKKGNINKEDIDKIKQTIDQNFDIYKQFSYMPKITTSKKQTTYNPNIQIKPFKLEDYENIIPTDTGFKSR